MTEAEQIQALQNEVAGLKSRIAAQTEKHNTAKGELATAQGRVRELETSATGHTAALKAAQDASATSLQTVTEQHAASQVELLAVRNEFSQSQALHSIGMHDPNARIVADAMFKASGETDFAAFVTGQTAAPWAVGYLSGAAPPAAVTPPAETPAAPAAAAPAAPAAPGQPASPVAAPVAAAPAPAGPANPNAGVPQHVAPVNGAKTSFKDIRNTSGNKALLEQLYGPGFAG